MKNRTPNPRLKFPPKPHFSNAHLIKSCRLPGFRLKHGQHTRTDRMTLGNLIPPPEHQPWTVAERGKNSAVSHRSVFETQIIQDLKRFLSGNLQKASLVPVMQQVFHSGFILVTQKLTTLANSSPIRKTRTQTVLYTNQHQTFRKLYTPEAAPSR